MLFTVGHMYFSHYRPTVLFPVVVKLCNPIRRRRGVGFCPYCGYDVSLYQSLEPELVPEDNFENRNLY